MRLDIDSWMFFDELPGELKLSITGRWREARCYRVVQTIAAMPAIDELL